MARCSMCGKEIHAGEVYEFEGKRISGLCTTCKSGCKLLLSQGTSDKSKAMGYNYLKKQVEGRADMHPELRALLNSWLEKARKATPDIESISQKATYQSASNQSIPASARVYRTWTEMADTIITIVYVLMIIAGLIGGAVVGEGVGAIIGMLVAAIAGFFMFAVIKIVIEISRNNAISAMAVLRIEEKLNSEKE